MASTIYISAVIITKNEERNIGRCIDSLQDIADEVIIVDSFSTDNTQEICTNKGATFVQHQWLGYAATKNYANSLARGEYLLSLDADEALSKEAREQLLIYKHKGFSAQAYTINRLTNYCGQFIKHCGWYPDTKIRLWKKGKGNWDGLIHEKVKLDADVTPDHLNGDILHYSYSTINEHLSQIILFTDLMATDIYNKGKKVGAGKLLISPLVKFIRGYFVQKGFKDGLYGFAICILSSMATFLKYTKARQLYLQNRK